MAAVLLIHAHWPWFWPLWGGVLGAVMGSFLACMIERRARGEGLRQPPSHCPNCNTLLRPIDLIPIASWLLRRGKCGYCKAPIPPGLLLAEIAGALLGGALVWGLLP